MDYDLKTGIMKLSDVANFSGLYRVIKVESKFNDGVFTQDLTCLMLDGQESQTGNKTVTPPNQIPNNGWGEG